MPMKKKAKKNAKADIKSRAILIVIILLAAAAEALYQYYKAQKLNGDGLTVHFVDVGQGDCELICCDGKNVLIDCGEESKAADVIAYLNKYSVKNLDYIIATHPHSDHMGSMSRVIEEYSVGEIIMPHLSDKDIPNSRYFEKFLDACDAHKTKVTEAEIGRKLEIGSAEAEIISPNGESYDDVNNYSVGIILTYGMNSFFMAGDAEALSEKEMLKTGRIHDVDVYKAGHHGSSSSGSAAFLKVIKPEISVICCGVNNSYGHPSQKTLKALKKYSTEIYRTDLNGSITIHSDGTRLTVTPERESK